jgi:hypothetical protein
VKLTSYKAREKQVRTLKRACGSIDKGYMQQTNKQRQTDRVLYNKLLSARNTLQHSITTYPEQWKCLHTFFDYCFCTLMLMFRCRMGPVMGIYPSHPCLVYGTHHSIACFMFSSRLCFGPAKSMRGMTSLESELIVFSISSVHRRPGLCIPEKN